MNIQEIRDLKQELEAALQKAFADFHTKTGMGVRGVDITAVRVNTMCSPSAVVSQVTIKLENL